MKMEGAGGRIEKGKEERSSEKSHDGRSQLYVSGEPVTVNFSSLREVVPMAKHPRKRQKTTEDSSSATQRALIDDASKDDEERRLESLLFGTKFVPRTQDYAVPQDGASKEMQNLIDTDVLSRCILLYFIF